MPMAEWMVRSEMHLTLPVALKAHRRGATSRRPATPSASAGPSPVPHDRTWELPAAQHDAIPPSLRSDKVEGGSHRRLIDQVGVRKQPKIG